MANTDFYGYLRSLTPTLSVGIISADLMHLEDELKKLDDTGVNIIHFDVMDGNFCPAMTVGATFIKSVKTKLIKDVHLMIVQPESKLGWFAEAGADILTVHLEACQTHIHGVLQAIKKLKNINRPEMGIIAGVAINPGTPVESIKSVLDVADMITILAVNPGWQTQSFIKTTQQKIETAISLISQSGRDIFLCVDGGITRENIVDISQMAADIVVAGSAVFDRKNPAENARFLLGYLKRGRKKYHET